jgi:hypothetical protein
VLLPLAAGDPQSPVPIWFQPLQASPFRCISLPEL